MTNRIRIFDTTLRDGEQSPGATMSLPEKLRLAQQLQRLGVDIIEAGFPAASQGDFEAVKAIAESTKGVCIAGLCRALPQDIDRAWEAICHAESPRLHTFLATSPIHMRYKLKKTPDEVVAMVIKGVQRAASYTSDVEFSAEDASRSTPDFLVRVFEAAIDAGATTINIPDTVGYAQPEEFGNLIRYVIEHTKNIEKAIVSVHCHNDLGLAIANTLAALHAGARQAEVTLCGIGERAGNAALEELAMVLKTRQDYYGLSTGIVTEQLYPACRLLSMMIGQPTPPNKAIIGTNAFAHESGIHQDGMLKHRDTYEIMTPESIGRTSTELVLGKHSGRNAVNNKLKSMGYHLEESDQEVIFSAVKHLADKKRQIHDEDIEALVLEEVYRIPDSFKLKNISVHCSDTSMPSTAAVLMDVCGVEHRHAEFGTGPIDAAFNAIAHVVQRSPQLESYTVNAITGGTDAQGEVTVRLREKQYTAVGRGSHPDIIIASARAFINALNRLAKKENDRENI